MNKRRSYHKVFQALFGELVGKTLWSIVRLDDELLTFSADDGSEYQMLYYHDCCAGCSIEDICGDLDDLVGSTILLAEEVSSSEPDEQALVARKAEFEAEKQRSIDAGREYYYKSFEDFCRSRYESETWTFYKLSTIKGSVTIRWYGSSNGYYSESATFEQTKLGINDQEIQ